MGGSCFLLQGTRIADRREAGSRGPETADVDSGIPSKLKNRGACMDRLRGRMHLRPFNLMWVMPP